MGILQWLGVNSSQPYVLLPRFIFIFLYCFSCKFLWRIAYCSSNVIFTSCRKKVQDEFLVSVVQRFTGCMFNLLVKFASPTPPFLNTWLQLCLFQQMSLFIFQFVWNFLVSIPFFFFFLFIHIYISSCLLHSTSSFFFFG